MNAKVGAHEFHHTFTLRHVVTTRAPEMRVWVAPLETEHRHGRISRTLTVRPCSEDLNTSLQQCHQKLCHQSVPHQNCFPTQSVASLYARLGGRAITIKVIWSRRMQVYFREDQAVA